ncbi:MFS general substrate transporter [Aspergillus sclerotioniger CBS 115572]|uniref:MFS general substrate transporter n=1 Tax=Aspergillus sclerotioniger CBS 115572 TaxID=1450535 RepID=A0A317V9R3_9EURO|nr:MFS general substrate transporter [Aspergillus sclerotioniger CBS 115572]PWY71064.1 MFS general substrate transporter [Aspergillus sclerotioniger CBS 115572]
MGDNRDAEHGNHAQDGTYPVTESTSLLPKANSVREVKSKILATNYAAFVAGLNDAALGVLIPYIQPTYDVGLLQVSMIYLVNFMGWLVACFANIHVCSYLGTGGTLVLGASIQCFGYALMFWSPPFPLFMAAFFFSGCGVAFQDAQMNTFTITVKDAHRWLGVLHAVYGVGTIVGPLIANTIASQMPVWHHYYLVTMFLAALNIASLAWTFRKGLFRPNVGSSKETAGKELRDTVANWTVWIFNGFFFLYVGAEVTAGGWLVQFLVSVRNGDPKKVGYIASGFWTGFTLGRVALADITHRLGERRMVFVYTTLALAMQLLFWLIPNITVNAVTVCFLGFFIGPFYPVGLYVLTKVIPEELHVGAMGFTASIGQAGSAAFPFMTGAIASQAGVQVLQPIMVGLLLGIAFFWTLVPRQRPITL